MINDLQWKAIIRGVEFQVDFSAKTYAKAIDGPLKISRMFGLKKDGFDYILALLSNGTYRLYSKGKKKLYTAGMSKTIRFIPIVTTINETIH